MVYRTEKDYLGEMEIPAESLYGIHSLRASGNFPDTGRFNLAWYKAVGTVKKVCYLTCKSFNNAVRQHRPEAPIAGELIPDTVLDALVSAADEVAAGEHFGAFIVPAISGGAGTSINMNVNEIIANRASQILGKAGQNSPRVDPIEHANIYQSTNDVIPTALKVAAMHGLELLESAINGLRFVIEEKETVYRDVMRIGYTQMQAAVPSSFGMLFSNYSDALSRDWWRISKGMERIKVVNLGGGATGTGMAVPRYFIVEVVNALRNATGLPVTRAENMSDATSNLDALVEVHAVVKALAVNLEKIAGDVRLLASDLTSGDLVLPQRQVGSSIMPGKVNPVIPEYVISVSHRVYANDQVITSLAAQGCLELNAYIPLIGDALLNSLELLAGACNTLKSNLFEGLTIRVDESESRLYMNPAISTVLVPVVGYNKASGLAMLMKEQQISITEANSRMQLVDEKKLASLLAPRELLKMGFSIKEL